MQNPLVKVAKFNAKKGQDLDSDVGQFETRWTINGFNPLANAMKKEQFASSFEGKVKN